MFIKNKGLGPWNSPILKIPTPSTIWLLSPRASYFFNVPIVCIWNMVIRSWSMAMMCGGGCWSPIVYTKLRLQLIVCLLQNQYTTHLNKYLSDRNSVYGRRGIWRTTNTAYYLFKKIKYVCSFYYRNNLLLIWFDLYPNSLIDWGFAKGKG